LENLEQYLKYRIPPAKKLLNLYEAYMKIMGQQERLDQEKSEIKLQYVLDLWKRRGKNFLLWK
jgi:hypothetical protein